MSCGRRLYLAVEAEGAGRHPAAWRAADARPEDLFRAEYYVDLARAADRGGLDLLFLPDTFAPPGVRPGSVRGRLDAVAVAARVAPVTSRLGLVPTASTTHTEPFHLSKALATVDYASSGRAGWQIEVSETEHEAELFGRKRAEPPERLWAEAADAAEVVVRLWDSWEDAAVIRDLRTGRYVDRDKLHYVDFEGEFFSVRGPSITPRPPQGHPLIAVRDSAAARAAAAHYADVVRIAAPDLDAAREARSRVRAAVHEAGRDPDSVAVLLDVEIRLAASRHEAKAALAELDSGAQHVPSTASVVGSALDAADFLSQAQESGAADGVTVVPLALPSDLTSLVDEVVPLLEPRSGEPATLRERFGLPRPHNLFTS